MTLKFYKKTPDVLNDLLCTTSISIKESFRNIMHSIVTSVKFNVAKNL